MRKRILLFAVSGLVLFLAGIVGTVVGQIAAVPTKAERAAGMIIEYVEGMTGAPMAEGCRWDGKVILESPSQLPLGPAPLMSVTVWWRLPSGTLCGSATTWVFPSEVEAFQMWELQADNLEELAVRVADKESWVALARMVPVCITGYKNNPCSAALVSQVGPMVIWAMTFADTTDQAEGLLKDWYLGYVDYLEQVFVPKGG